MYIHSFQILLPCPAQSEVKFQRTLPPEIPPEIMFPTISSFLFICSRLGRGILTPSIEQLVYTRANYCDL